MAQRQKTNINVYQGDDRDYRFTMTANGVPFNVSGATGVTLSVKQNITDSTALFESTATDGNNGNNFATGVLVFTITKAQSALLVRNGVYEVRLTLASKDKTVVFGDINLQLQVA